LLVSAITYAYSKDWLLEFFWWSRSWDSEASIAGAVTLAIGLDEFSEGIAVSMPLRRMGMSRWKSFMYGQSSALVEPIAAVLGALQLHFSPNFTLCFAAGAMIFVVVEEVIQRRNRIIIRTSPDGIRWGFIVMMVLDVALG
jgi:ZIP family zinc transporter